MAQKLIGTGSFWQAEAITKEVCGRTELDHERRKAESRARNRREEPSAEELRNRLQEYFHGAVLRGATLVSFRRLTEVLEMHRYNPPAIRALIGSLAIPNLPLGRIAPLA